MPSKERLREFLREAKINAYAGSDENNSRRLRDGGKKITYRKNNFYYRDIYYGFNPFIGEEIVFDREKPIWAMNYRGQIIREPIPAKEIYFFLRRALKRVNKGKPFRGPSNFRFGDFEYLNNVKGKLEKFIGEEKIFYKKELVYKLDYHGGFIGR